MAASDKPAARVLLVDDERNEFLLTRRLMSEIREWDFTLDWVATAEEALQQFTRQPHDAYLIDLRLGAVSGLELTRELIAQHCAAPIIVLTGLDDARVDRDAMAAGAVDYLVKGRLDAVTLERSIRHGIERKRVEGLVRQRTDELAAANQTLRKTNAELQSALTSVREGEERYRSVILALDEGILVQDSEGVVRACNPSAERILGLPAGQLVGRTSLESAGQALREDGSDFPAQEQPGRVTLRTGRPLADVVMGLRRAGGALAWLSLNSQPLFHHGESRPRAAVISFTDISERKRAEQVLGRLAAIVESSNDAIISQTLDNMIQSWNVGAERIFAYLAEEAIGQSIGIIVPPEQAGEWAAIGERISRGESVEHFETIRIRKDGRKINASLSLSPIKNGTGTIIGASIIARDVTENKRAEERIRASLREKEVLLKEIHHRVKNNLQIISSLLELERANSAPDANAGFFRDTQNRIRSMAFIHEQLYRSKDLARLDFAEYLRDLTNDLFGSCAPTGADIHLKLETDPVYFDIDSAIPCGLIVNELVSNCLKHAFPRGRAGEILVQLRAQKNNCTLMVRDNGVGLPQNLDPRNAASLGLQLIAMLSDQLGGHLQINREAGTEFVIQFTLPESRTPGPAHAIAY